MKVLLITPTNKLFMPYLSNYKEIYDRENIEYDVILWDRLNYVENEKYIYRDSKIGSRRGFYDYYKYSRYIKGILEKNKYDKVIVFGLQILFFIHKLLIKEYKNKFIVDIRDYNKIKQFMNLQSINHNSEFFVISSEGYKKFLDGANKIVINHNTKIKSIKELHYDTNFSTQSLPISIGSVGSLRDLDANFALVDELQNKMDFLLNYDGQGSANQTLAEYITENNIRNVEITGKYERAEEEGLYKKNKLINVLRYPDSLNNKVALPNRLYNASLFGIPLLALEGTALSEIINKYNLGYTFTDFKSLDEQIISYLDNFDVDNYNLGRKQFMEQVIKENSTFEKKIVSY